jgi:hypothetical protein
VQNYIEIFLIGLFGSMHCIGMCGGFVGMYSLRRPADRPALPSHLLYNLGRITTYSALGGILGRIGSFAAYAVHRRGIPGMALMLAGLLMVVMGFNIAGMTGKRGFLGDGGITGTSLFRKALHQALSLRTWWGTFALGLLLGLLPCGLLYPVLVHAASSGGFVPGALTMAVFGLGTTPAMMSFGHLLSRIQPRSRRSLYRIAAVLIVLLGLQSLLRGMAFNGWIAHGRFW